MDNDNNKTLQKINWKFEGDAVILPVFILEKVIVQCSK